MATIKKGTYRFNDVLTIPSGLSGELVIPINYTTRRLFGLDGTTLVPVYTLCDLNTITISLQDGVLIVNESYIENGVTVRYFDCYSSDGKGWNVQAYMSETMGYTNYAIAKGFGQIINVTEDTVVDDEYVADWFNENAKTRMFTKLNVGETVYSSGGKCFKRLAAFVPFTVTADNRGMIGYTDSTTDLIIPATFQDQEETLYKVVAIGSSAFSNCTSLTSIEIPDSVTSIGSYAFRGCSSLTSVEIPKSVTSIGSAAFDTLESVYITDIASWCNVSIPNDTYNVNYTMANPLTGANLYLNGELVTELIIPDTVKTIKSFAFYGCASLTSVVIGDGVTSIGASAFLDCTSLTSIEFGKCSPSISTHPFPDNLKSVYVTDMASWCKIYFPYATSNPLYRGANLYLNGELVTTALTLPDTVTTIRPYVLYGLTSLTNLYISDSVTHIYTDAFAGCDSLIDIKVDENNPSYKVIDGNLYSKDGKKIIYLPTKNYSSFTIPDGVTHIGDKVFYKCTSLTRVVIPDSVTSIGGQAFYNCTSLTSIEIPDSVTSIGEEAFYGCKGIKSLVIPNGVKRLVSSTFYGCTSLTSIVIPDSVTFISSWVFKNCSALSSIKYYGTQEQWDAIFKYSDWASGAGSFTITYNYTD